ncbi:hypothetical protein HYPSUDRAFT_199733 [Hypholoma sublateritium FD-334 SS-4]|uniref:Uncharacterized protein n=1 Tax=Hypholoma sublateritium (strain FD-334 SS-4) TaxID=945553 RepID=A0A0D2P409_HYPSF|nr:hypothetical protein HYPSUDRAFT_199733 [Hypholoma sublateritium FD-334 SS-4]
MRSRPPYPGPDRASVQSFDLTLPHLSTSTPPRPSVDTASPVLRPSPASSSSIDIALPHPSTSLRPAFEIAIHVRRRCPDPLRLSTPPVQSTTAGNGAKSALSCVAAA